MGIRVTIHSKPQVDIHFESPGDVAAFLLQAGILALGTNKTIRKPRRKVSPKSAPASRQPKRVRVAVSKLESVYSQLANTAYRKGLEKLVAAGEDGMTTTALAKAIGVKARTIGPVIRALRSAFIRAGISKEVLRSETIKTEDGRTTVVRVATRG